MTHINFVPLQICRVKKGGVSMKNYTAEVIPFIPVSSWSYHEETYLTGHIYKHSNYECADTCGTCDGAMCDYCERVTRREVTLDLTTKESRELFKRAFPGELDWELCTLPILPTIQDVYNTFPELYKAIISFLHCPDLIQEAEDAKKAREEKARLSAEQEKELKEREEIFKRRVYIGSSLSESGFKGTLMPRVATNCHCRCDKEHKSFLMAAKELSTLESCIPDKIIECLNSTHTSPQQDHHGVRYEIPLAWLADCGIMYAYKAK